jgi:hypothetical protein
LAVAAAILLLLAVTGAIEGIGTKLFQKNQFVPIGDRIAAILLGGALVRRVSHTPGVKPEVGLEPTAAGLQNQCSTS